MGTCSIRTRSSSPPTTSSTPTCRACSRTSRITSAPARGCSRRDWRCPRTSRCSRPRTPSTCWMRGAPFQCPSAGMKAERRDFLLEIGTEELPPRSLHALQQALVTALSAGLARADLAHGELVGFATPRRLAVWVKRLAAQQPEQHLKRRGPPLQVLLGLLRGE